MAQVNTCLKRTFTIFNVLFAILGAVVFSLAILVHVVSTNNETFHLDGRYGTLIILYLVGGATMGIGLLGVYGVLREKYAAMVVFLVFMICGSLAMLRIGIPAAVLRPQMDGILEDTFRKFTPLNSASEEVQVMMSNLQSTMHCCGLFGADDWNDEIPASCLCDEHIEDDCRVIDYMGLMRRTRSIYSQTCLPFIMHYALLGFNIVLAVFFTLCAVFLLGLVLSALIVHQMRFSKTTPSMQMSVPAIFAQMPPKYEELKNPPCY